MLDRFNGWERLTFALSATWYVVTGIIAALIYFGGGVYLLPVILGWYVAWFVPAFAVFLLGHSIAWIIRGFTTSARRTTHASKMDTRNDCGYATN